MDITALLTGAGISTGIGIIGKVVGFWKDSGVTAAQMEERLNTFKDELQTSVATTKQTTADFNTHLKETVSELRAVVLTVAKLQSSQDVTNVMVNKTLESIVHRCEANDRMSIETQNMLGRLIGEIKLQNSKT